MNPESMLTRKLMARQNLSRSESAALLDEATITGPSRVRGYRRGEGFDFELRPEDAGLATATPESIAPADTASNLRDFLETTGDPGVLRQAEQEHVS